MKWLTVDRVVAAVLIVVAALTAGTIECRVGVVTQALAEALTPFGL